MNKANEPILVGADLGTNSVRVGLYNLEGKCLGEGRKEYQIDHPRPGFAEMNAETWVKALGGAFSEALLKSEIDRKRLVGLGITHMRQTFVCLGEELRPVRRAILWYDTRCNKEAEWACQNVGAEWIYRRTGSPPGRRGIYKLMWIRNNEPEVYRKTYKVASISDYLAYRLTGNLVTCPGVAATTGCLDVQNPTNWAFDIIEKLSIDPHKYISAIFPPGSIAGRITEKAEEEMGIPAGLPVVLTAGDQACGNLGNGAIYPGIVGINGGTSCAIQMLSNTLPLSPDLAYFIDFNPEGKYIAENGITSGGGALMKWYRENFGLEEEERARREGESIWTIIYDKLGGKTPPGAGGLLLIPYLRGANGPYWDTGARGLLLGLRSYHGRGHFVRAIIEGLAYESRSIIEAMTLGSGIKAEEVRMYGGSAKSPTWNQTFADVLNLEVKTTEEEETPSLGAAITCGKAVGLFDSLEAATRTMVRLKTIYKPREDYRELYDRLYHEVYSELYGKVKDLVKKVNAILPPA